MSPPVHDLPESEPFSAFWTALLPHWEVRSACGPVSFQLPVFLDADALFSILRTALPDHPDNLMISSAGQTLGKTETRELLPSTADRTFHYYHERLLRTLGGQQYMGRVGHVQMLDRSIWNWARRFLRPLIASVGLPNETIEMGMFFGNYDKTSFGVHVDHQSALTFPVLGKKHVRVWDDRFVSNSPGLAHSVSYDSFKTGSTLLEASPGEFMYWPSDEWHIGEGTGTLVVTCNISFWYVAEATFRQQLTRQIVDGVLPAGDPPAARSAMHLRPGSVAPRVSRDNLPASVRENADQLVQLLTPDRIRTGASRAWMVRLSGSGFARVPGPTAVLPVTPGDAVRGLSADALLWMDLGNGDMAIAANGYEFVFRVDDAAVLDRLVTGINSGEWLGVERLISEFTGGAGDQASKDAFGQWLTTLMSIGALECRRGSG